MSTPIDQIQNQLNQELEQQNPVNNIDSAQPDVQLIDTAAPAPVVGGQIGPYVSHSQVLRR
jgi:hypothetical protein